MTDFSATAMPVSTLGIHILALAAALHFTPRPRQPLLETYRRLPALAQSAVIVGTFYVLAAVATAEAPFVYFQF